MTAYLCLSLSKQPLNRKVALQEMRSRSRIVWRATGANETFSSLSLEIGSVPCGARASLSAGTERNFILLGDTADVLGVLPSQSIAIAHCDTLATLFID